MFCCVADKFPSACIRQQSTLHLLPRRKKEALHEKELGNEAYKAKRFDEAIAHYDRCAACLATCLPLLAAVSLPQLPSNRCALGCAVRCLPTCAACLPAFLSAGPSSFGTRMCRSCPTGRRCTLRRATLSAAWQTATQVQPLLHAAIVCACVYPSDTTRPAHLLHPASALTCPPCCSLRPCVSGVRAPAAAVERGRELRADYKLVARALTRKANALVKLGRLEEAVTIYQKSLTEHRWGWNGWGGLWG